MSSVSTFCPVSLWDFQSCWCMWFSALALPPHGETRLSRHTSHQSKAQSIVCCLMFIKETDIHPSMSCWTTVQRLFGSRNCSCLAACENGKKREIVWNGERRLYLLCIQLEQWLYNVGCVQVGKYNDRSKCTDYPHNEYICVQRLTHIKTAFVICFFFWLMSDSKMYINTKGSLGHKYFMETWLIVT